MIVDLFAGGGGASTGIEWALNRSPDIAINHNPKALAMHVANHPRTQHLCGDGLARSVRCRGSCLSVTHRLAQLRDLRRFLRSRRIRWWCN